MASLTQTHLHDHLVHLTPVKANRKKRPSFSPTKSRQQAEPKAQSQSEVLTQKPTLSNPESDIATASLEFEEFTYWNDDGVTMKNSTNAQSAALVQFLGRRFRVTEMQESQPFLILWCRGGVPTQDERPFSIAGCIAVWLEEGAATPEDLSIGDFGEGEFEIAIDASIAADLRPFHMPKEETLSNLAKYFPGCTHVSFIVHQIVIEYATEDFQTFSVRRQKLPWAFENVGLPLSYHNGPLVQTQLKRFKKPEPRFLNGAEDDTDYVKTQGCFFPGTKISADSGQQVSTGIMVQRGQESRITVAFHCWDEEYKDFQDKLGDLDKFSVTQGETLVGNIVERIGTTDIGLAKLKDGIAFHNRFLDIPTTAKTLTPLENLAVNDEFLIDTFVTGRQRLRLQGKRVPNMESLPALKGSAQDLPPPGRYVSFSQGIYATGSTEIPGTPKIREGVCGSAVVRV